MGVGTPPQGVAAGFARRRRATAAAACAIAVLMTCLAYAAVPLYGMFCRATGYGGTPRIAASGPATRGTRTLTVRFDANVLPGLPWSFAPETPSVAMRTGTTATVYFSVRNRSGDATAARAQYNISPEIGGFYFNKISCFCFDEQRLGPNAEAELPVVFFLDPALDKDPTMRNVDTLTLSYTFAAVKPPSGALAARKVESVGSAPKL